jgi:CRP-like cAMP-binding protein
MRELSCQNLLAQRNLSSFSSASVFGALPESSIRWLLERGRIRALDEGEYLFSPGEPGNSFHVILQGRVAYYKYHLDRYAFIRDYEVGEQIGFMSLIALHNRVGRAEAYAGTIALEIDSALFHAFHEEQPLEFGILMLNLAREMARTLRAVDNLLVEKS